MFKRHFSSVQLKYVQISSFGVSSPNAIAFTNPPLRRCAMFATVSARISTQDTILLRTHPTDIDLPSKRTTSKTICHLHYRLFLFLLPVGLIYPFFSSRRFEIPGDLLRRNIFLRRPVVCVPQRPCQVQTFPRTQFQICFIPYFYDRSEASSKVSCPYTAFWSFHYHLVIAYLFVLVSSSLLSFIFTSVICFIRQLLRRIYGQSI
jgi:hypothetical protein